MKIIYAKDYDDMSKKAAALLAAVVTAKPDCVLGLATGSTPVGLYRELIRGYEEGRLDFSRVRTVNLDEYCGLTADSDQSYVYFMRENLFDHINIDPANTHIPNGANPDAAAECARYDALLDAMPADIQLLGIGNNGHIGFNEPADSFAVGTHQVMLTKSTIDANARFFAKPEDVPRSAYTMGIAGIMRAKKILLVANGVNKAEIIEKVATGPVCPQVPASVLRLHPDVTIVADSSALGCLQKSCPALISEE